MITNDFKILVIAKIGEAPCLVAVRIEAKILDGWKRLSQNLSNDFFLVGDAQEFGGFAN